METEKRLFGIQLCFLLTALVYRMSIVVYFWGSNFYPIQAQFWSAVTVFALIRLLWKRRYLEYATMGNIVLYSFLEIGLVWQAVEIIRILIDDWQHMDISIVLYVAVHFAAIGLGILAIKMTKREYSQ